MILLSDNTSTNVLIDTLGRDAINTRMHTLGAKGYLLRRRMMDGEAAARGDENVASPADLLVVMDAIRTGRGLQPASHAEAIRILREYGPTSIRAGVPVGRACRRQARRPRRRPQRGRLGGAEGPAVHALRDDQLPGRRSGRRQGHHRHLPRVVPVLLAPRTSGSRRATVTAMKDCSPQCRTLHRKCRTLHGNAGPLTEMQDPSRKCRTPHGNEGPFTEMKDGSPE